MQGTALAMWAFINPVAAVQANAWIAAHIQPSKEKRKGNRAASLKDRIVLSEQQLHDLSAHLGRDEHQRNYVQIVFQHHGELIHIPSGWIHQVTNLQDCIKVAWDYYVPAHMSCYASAWKLIHAQVTKTNASDYMAFMGVLNNACKHYFEDFRRGVKELA